LLLGLAARERSFVGFHGALPSPLALTWPACTRAATLAGDAPVPPQLIDQRRAGDDSEPPRHRARAPRRQQIPYAYLDGKTQDRKTRVQRFHRPPSPAVSTSARRPCLALDPRQPACRRNRDARVTHTSREATVQDGK